MSSNTKTAAPRARLGWLDFAKGIGILLVVWAHAKGPLSNYIYNFHMPFFFLISGYLYNARDSLGTFVKKRVLTLYLPFLFWNLLAFAIQYATQYVPISAQSTLRLVKLTILTLDKNGRLFGASWFLGSLFVVAILYKVLDLLLSRVPYKRFVITGLFVIGGIAAFCVTLPYGLSRTVILAMFYAVGYLVRENQESWKKYVSPWLAIVCVICFFVMNQHNSANMRKNTYTSPAMFVLGSFFMSYAILYLSYLLERVSKRGITHKAFQGIVYIGKQSIDLLLWQFVFFRVVTLMQILRWHLPLSTILEHTSTFHTEKIWWLLYFLAGSLLPLLWGYLLRFGPWGKVLKKLHFV